MEIGERIRKIRETEGLSQRVFSSSIKIGQSTLAMFEKGQREPKSIHIEQICSKYNISEEWLRTGKGEMKLKKNLIFGDICADIGVNDPKAKEAIIKYYELSNEDKELWWKWMEKFLK